LAAALLRLFRAGIGQGVGGGMLDPAVDPKLAWALNKREQFAVYGGRAPREILLRLPEAAPRLCR